jgi:hypothetical protein
MADAGDKGPVAGLAVGKGGIVFGIGTLTERLGIEATAAAGFW